MRVEAFTKVVRIGTQRTWAGRAYSVYVRIKVEQRGRGPVLRMTGAEGPLANGGYIGAGGQIVMSMNAGYLATLRYAPG